MKKVTAILMSLAIIYSMSFSAVLAEEKADNTCNDFGNLIVAYDNDGNRISSKKVDDDTYNGFIFALKDDLGKKELKNIKSEVNDISDSKCKEIYENKFFKADSLKTIEKVAEPDEIEYIEPDYYRELCVSSINSYIPNDTYYSNNEWAYSAMHVQELWSIGITGKGQNGNSTPTVAVIDSGIAGFTSTSGSVRHSDLNYSNIPSVSYMTSFGNGNDDNGHGTFVIGEIAATLNNNIGVAGVAPDVTILPAKVANSNGKASTSDIVTMINYIVQEKTGIEVINICLGSSSYSSAEYEAVQNAVNQGIIVVASSGNSGNSDYNYPSSYDNVIGVASIDENYSRSSFSQYNSTVDVAAPGENIIGLNYQYSNGYSSMSGTSAAAPWVSGLAALAKSMDNSITAQEFMEILQKTSTDIGSSGYDIYTGYGIPNFEAVYKYIFNKTHVHEWENTYTIDKKATCTEKGEKSIHCKTCSERKNITSIATIDHTWDTGYISKEATCTKTGNKVFTCVYCNKTKNETIAALGHDTIHHEAKAATCTESGWAAYVTCSRCDYSSYSKISALGHDTIHHEAKAATCTESGWEAYDTCSRCDYSTYLRIVPLGHQYEHQFIAPKIGIKGYEYDLCEMCEDVINETSIAALTPSATKIKSLKALKKGFTVKWSKKSYSGYQIRYSLKSSMASSKSVTVTKASTISKKITKLKSKKKYYVQVRAFKTVEGKKYYSKWSSRKSIKTK